MRLVCPFHLGAREVGRLAICRVSRQAVLGFSSEPVMGSTTV
jgi:hypothetical protein